MQVGSLEKAPNQLYECLEQVPKRSVGKFACCVCHNMAGLERLEILEIPRNTLTRCCVPDAWVERAVMKLTPEENAEIESWPVVVSGHF